MPSLAQIHAGTVRLDDARRGTSREVALLAFEIGIHPVTLTEFGDPAAQQAHPGDAPMAGVRWIDAIRWCNAASLAASPGRNPLAGRLRTHLD